MLTLLDTGCRISEALDLRVSDCDLENMLMTLKGKGQKERKVPFSFELRKAPSENAGLHLDVLHPQPCGSFTGRGNKSFLACCCSQRSRQRLRTK